MKKEEFLNKLRKKLSILEDKEIEDIISEYDGFIEEKVKRGITEEEAVKELGDLEEIAQDLLGAYKVKPQETNTLKKFINKVSYMFDVFLKELETKDWKDILRMIIEIGLIIVLILVLKIPFLLLKDLGSSIFSELANPLSNIFYGIWSFIIEVSFFLIAIILFIKIIERRYFKNFSASIVKEITEEPEKEKKEKEEQNENKVIKKTPKDEKKSKKSIVEIFINICVLFLKFIVGLFLIGVIFYLIGITFALALDIYLLIKGVTYFGVLIILIAMFLSGLLILEIGTYFIFNKRIKAKNVLIEGIICIILTGFGLAFSTIEIANTQISYEKVENTKTVSREIEASENIALYGNYNIIIDNTLNNTIRIEYVYPDLYDVEVQIRLNNYDNGYYLDEEISDVKWNKEMLNNLINDLQDKKIVIPDFKIEKNVYMSEETQDLINHNKEMNNNDNDVIYEFTRTYNVLNVEESNDDAYVYLVLRQFQFEEIATVKVLKSLSSHVEVGNNYEFTFRYNYPTTTIQNDSIEELFNKCQLISIEYTDKLGMEQTQDSEIPYN